MEDQAPYRNLFTAMKEQAEQDKVFMERATIALENLNLVNSPYAEMIVSLVEDLADFTLSSGDEPIAELEIDEEYGKGINLYRIAGSLGDYARDDDDEDLDVALAYIFREKERRLLNEL